MIKPNCVYKKKSDGKLFNRNNGGQVTPLIILGIVIAIGILIYFFLYSGLSFGGPPKDFEGVYNHYLSCIEREAEIGASVLGQQGGHMMGPDFSAGSDFMPFSNYLNFVVPVPYWYYISGNGLAKEQVPSIGDMEEELNDFISERIQYCDFSSFNERGYLIEGRDAVVNTKIKNKGIEVRVNQELNFNFGDSSWTSRRHLVEANSNLGRFYEIARKIYDDFKESLFLEDYGVDVLRLYAPVDGVKVQCNPAVWNVEEVRDDLMNGLEANIPFIKIKGDYYDLRNSDNEYFVHDLGEDIEANVNFLFSRDWPNKMEVWPNDGGLLIAESVGNQEGLGMLGFCYVPYHFVYDLAYPVLIQTYFDDEIFQFPVVVYINKNKPREPIEGSHIPNQVPELCQHKNADISVSTFNTNLEPIEAEIKFKCLDTSCRIGETNNGELNAKFPQCKNGFVIARADGYETKEEIFSTINPGSLSLFLDREYKLDVEVESVGGVDNSIITFTKDGKSRTVAYPEQKFVELTAGQYEIKVIVYSDASIDLAASVEQKCIDVPVSGIGGIFGFTDEKCFDLEIPGQQVNQGVSGGGTQNYFISESELEGNDKIVLRVSSFGSPSKVEDLQINYNRVDISDVGVRFE